MSALRTRLVGWHQCQLIRALIGWFPLIIPTTFGGTWWHEQQQRFRPRRKFDGPGAWSANGGQESIGRMFSIPTTSTAVLWGWKGNPSKMYIFSHPFLASPNEKEPHRILQQAHACFSCELLACYYTLFPFFRPLLFFLSCLSNKMSDDPAEAVINNARETMEAHQVSGDEEDGVRMMEALSVEKLDRDLYRSKDLWHPAGSRGAFGGQVQQQQWHFSCTFGKAASWLC